MGEPMLTVKKHNVQYKENISFSPVSLILTDQSSNRGYSMCFQSVAGDLWWRRKKGKTNTFESGMLTTKYLGAVSETNSSKSFSKGTVVNSRQFFATAYFRETKGTFSSWSTNGSLDKEKKEQKKPKHFSLYFCFYKSISKTKKTSDFSFWLSVSKATNKNKSIRFIVLTTDWFV